MVIGEGVTGLKKTGVMYLLGLFEGRGRSGGVISSVCVVPWANGWANVGSIDFFFTYGFRVLVKGNGKEFKDEIMLFCYFSSLECLNCRWVYGGGVEQRLLFRDIWNCFFCVLGFTQGWETQCESKISSFCFWF